MTKAMKYDHDNEQRACDLYLQYLKKHHHDSATVQKTGLCIDYQVCISSIQTASYCVPFIW